MLAGGLDRRIRLERKFETGRNTANEVEFEWRPLATVWAERKDVSDGERLQAQQIGATLTARFRVRRCATTLGLVAADRLVCGATVFEITGVKEVPPDGLELTTAAVLVTG